MCQFGLYLVLSYYTYQMKIVLTKISSGSLQEYLSKMKIITSVVVVYLITLIVSYTMEIIEKVEIVNRDFN